jgi:DNA-binding MarR family transcriptional regulator
MSAGEIAKWTGFTAASVTDLVDRLERKGFVRRASDPADRRRVMIEPVAQKVASARRHFDSARQALERLYQRYEEDELAVISDFLSRNAERLRAETARLQK